MEKNDIHYLDFASVEPGSDYIVTIRPVFSWLILLFVYSIVAWVLYSMVKYSPMTMGPGYKTAIAIFVAGFAVVYTVSTVRNGGFVLAANTGGVYYRLASSKDKAVFVPWLLVDKIALLSDADGGSWVGLTLSPDVIEKLPSPTNGDARRYTAWLSSSPCYHLDFTPGSGNDAGKIVARLKKFRSGTLDA